jgi:hypothetical protein
MRNRLLTLFMVALLSLTIPMLMAAAAPEEHHQTPEKHNHSEHRPALDWKAYPADIQALKVQLDDIRVQQKTLFEQIKSQHEQIHSARKALTSDKRKTVRTQAKQLLVKMKATKDEIHSMREKKHEAWDSFHEHAGANQWSMAKSDLEGIIKQKQQIYDKQQNILKLQRQLLMLISPTAQTHVHS